MNTECDHKVPHGVRGFPLNAHALTSCSAEDGLISPDGYVTIAGARDARVWAHRLRDDDDGETREVTAGQLNALALIHNLSHRVLDAYCASRATGTSLFDAACEWIAEQVGDSSFREFLAVVEDEFPLPAGNASPACLVRKLLFVWLANRNTAADGLRPLFHDRPLIAHGAYGAVMESLRMFFLRQPPYGNGGASVIGILYAPLKNAPHSLAGQLRFLEDEWRDLLDESMTSIPGAIDLIQEETQPRFGGHGPQELPVLAPFDGAPETENRFSADQDWMPRVVMVAKNVYVWLHQLSEQFGREISRLDAVPDEELDYLAERGFTALWLIGVWERSPASRVIKQRCGNPEAAGSAYSIFDYRVADQLGGAPACAHLRRRAEARGIRLASDMVPNHMGITSRWVYDHPERFMDLGDCPFPGYSFEGPDLSEDARVEIKIEDGYYDRSDAAVVFRRHDRETGCTRFVYHGNDGTSMPWNDTAQLNYLLPEVREAVIQTIIHVARQFPIIRFDAAMTLTRKHCQRLWFPVPGKGGAIPTRSEHGMTQAAFDCAMPREFWREVVDRVAAEAPDTLLLAEAFWLLEGYFVRTLGMHRVYNSAFMHMLRDEHNAGYRALMRKVLEHDPEVLNRFVNFMSNPDEETAATQFGKGDKYFGICVLLVTLPGTPMFGHGQFDGHAEKYGMEYQRAYWREDADQALLERHQREVSPLLHRRSLFAGVSEFLLYDCVVDGQSVNEDVFAYSNREGDTCALVLYYNGCRHATGVIRMSTAYAVERDGGQRQLVRRSLGEALRLSSDPDAFAVLRDTLGGLTYVYPCVRLHEEGLPVDLNAYECRVLTDVREVRDSPALPYARLARELAWGGLADIELALERLRATPGADE